MGTAVQGPPGAPTETRTATRATIDVRTLGIVLAVAAALLAAYALGAGQDGRSSSASADTGAGDESARPDEATMVMTGTGEATGVPKQMTFHVGIRSSAADVSAALAQANSTARHVLHRLRSEGVNPRDAKTTGLSVRPVYDYSDDGPPSISGYAASESLSVAVDDLSASGRVLGAAADAGGNAVRISGIKLGIADKDALMKRARQDAVEEATAKAQQYAEATGQELGPVISIREVMPGSAVPPLAGRSAFSELSADLPSSAIVPIRPGRSPLEVTVAVVWTFA